MPTPDSTGQSSEPGRRTDSILANLAGIHREVADSRGDMPLPRGTESEVDPLIYSRVVRAISAAGMGADLNTDETLNCLAESLNQEFLLTSTRVDAESLAEKNSALDIASMILRMLD